MPNVYVKNEYVKTSNPSHYEAGKTSYAVISPGGRRTWCKEFSGAVEHATNLIDHGNADEFLIIKVVGRVKKKKTPVEVEKFK